MRVLLQGLKKYRIGVLIILVLTFFRVLSELYLPTLMAEIVDEGIVHSNQEIMYKIGIWMVFVAAFGTICTCITSFYSAKVAAGFGKDIRQKIFYKVESFGLEEVNAIGTSSLINRTTNDINQVQQVTIMLLRMVIMAPMMCIGGIIMAVSKNAKLSLIFVVVIPILVLVIYFVIKKGMPLFKELQKRLDHLNSVLRENLTGIRVIRSFNKESYEQKRFQQSNRDLTTTALRVNRLMALTMPLMMIILNISTVAIVWFGGLQLNNGTMQVGDIMAFTQYGMQIMFSLMMVSMIFVMMPRASASADRINEVLEMPLVMKETVPNKKEILAEKGKIEFRNVSFAYPQAEQPVLHHLSFSINPGETTAIIGGTGSGKSTILHLITRFYDNTSGEILIDGVNINEIPLHTLRGAMGYVPQKAVLFSGTIIDNIRYGKEDATEDEVQKAVEISQSQEFISQLENGLHASISQGGNNLSGGQKQRLSIARALVRKPKIYLFDDSFSALDYRTDAKLRASLKKEVKDATMIVVAQRVSTIKEAEKIIVLDEGEIVGIGTHDDLMKNCDVYEEIVRSQGVMEEAVYE